MIAIENRIPESELASINRQMENSHPSDILRWVDGRFGNSAAQMSSFGLEDVALFDMYWRVNPKARVMTLDTPPASHRDVHALRPDGFAVLGKDRDLVPRPGVSC